MEKKYIKSKNLLASEPQRLSWCPPSAASWVALQTHPAARLIQLEAKYLF